MRLQAKLIRYLSTRPIKFWVVFSVLCYFIFYSTLSLTKHYTYHSTLLDLSNFEQILWNTSHGHWFALSTRPWTDTYLGDHFSLILLLPAFLYKIFPFTFTILLMQTAIIAASGYLIFLVAKNFKFTENQSFIFTLIFLLFPSTGLINMMDAHANVFAIPIGLLFLYAYQSKKFNLMTIFFLLLLCVKEDLSLVTAGFGLVLMMSKKDRFYGIFLVSASIAWLILTVNILIPHFTFTGGYEYNAQYAYLGVDAENGITSLIYKPIIVLKALFSLPKITYFVALFGPLIFLPIFAGRWFIPIMLGIIPVMLDSYTNLSTINYHYPASWLAFVFFALMAGILKISQKLKFNADKIIIPILIIQIVILSAGLSTNFLPNKYCKSYLCLSKYSQPQFNSINHAKELVPQQASLSVSNNLGPHFSKREALYLFPRIEKAKYILIDQSNLGRWGDPNDQMAFLQIKESNNYKLIYTDQNIHLFRAN